MATQTKKSAFDKLSAVNVSAKVERKGQLSYLSWAHRPKSIHLENITSFDVNTSIQRSTVKALALHGLGLSVYAGEDLMDTTPVVKKPKLINLEIEDDNWKKVIAWMIDNRDLGMPGIIKVLSQKYKIDPVVVDELSKFIKT